MRRHCCENHTPERTGELVRSVRGQADLESLMPREQEARARAVEAVSLARGGLSLSAAAREAGTTVRAVRRWAAPAVKRLPNGRYRVTRSDRLYRRLRVISSEGPVWVDSWSSREAQLASAHANAVRAYGVRTDADSLAPFRGRTVGGVELETDVLALGALASAGELDAFDLYSEAAT